MPHTEKRTKAKAKRTIERCFAHCARSFRMYMEWDTYIRQQRADERDHTKNYPHNASSRLMADYFAALWILQAGGLLPCGAAPKAEDIFSMRLAAFQAYALTHSTQFERGLTNLRKDRTHLSADDLAYFATLDYVGMVSGNW